MKLSFRPAHIQAGEAWLVSAVVHLVLLIVVSLLFVPSLGDMIATVELGAQFSDAVEVPVLFEMSPAPTLEKELDGSISSPSAESPTLEIEHPNVVADRSSPRLRRAALTEDDSPPSGTSDQASFFGMQATGNRFVYVVDVSGSMFPPRRLRAMTELLRSIDQLRANQEFYVVLFGSSTVRMFNEVETSTAIPATIENKRRLRRWLNSAPGLGGTNPREALQISLGMSADSVYFLSDGAFNLRPTMEIVKTKNVEQIPIHTIAFEEKFSESGMIAIATATGGRHRFVPADSTTAFDPRDRRSWMGTLHDDALLRVRFSGEKELPTSATGIQESEVEGQNLWLVAETLFRRGASAEAMQMHDRIVSEYPTSMAAKSIADHDRWLQSEKKMSLRRPTKK